MGNTQIKKQLVEFEETRENLEEILKEKIGGKLTLIFDGTRAVVKVENVDQKNLNSDGLEILDDFMKKIGFNSLVGTTSLYTCEEYVYD